MTSNGKISGIEMIAPENVTADSRVNTRPVDKTWVQRKHREGYDEKRIGVPTVSARSDGTYVWLDGQNRGALCVMAGRGGEKIAMKAFRGLSLAEEAELFLGLNDNRRVAPIYKFAAEVTACHPEAVSISRIVAEFGWAVSDAGNPNNIAAVAALSSIYRSTTPTGKTLRLALSVLTQAWGHTQEAVTAPLMLGLASVLNECPNLNAASLIKKLSVYDGGPSSLLGKGRGFRSATGCTVPQGVDQVIRMVYNNGRRAGRLNTWGPPAARTAAPQEQLSVRL
ncbi:DUF6551 family protein [Kitasatospora sp. NPDC058397]|uniref:DUF6551 family protein n=1 Tax=unclassified Kitasatospora TaxID=2633591 RepID=UPI00365661B6